MRCFGRLCVFEVDQTSKIEFTRINTAPANLNRRMSRSHGDLSQQFKALKGKFIFVSYYKLRSLFRTKYS